MAEVMIVQECTTASREWVRGREGGGTKVKLTLGSAHPRAFSGVESSHFLVFVRPLTRCTRTQTRPAVTNLWALSGSTFLTLTGNWFICSLNRCVQNSLIEINSRKKDLFFSNCDCGIMYLYVTSVSPWESQLREKVTCDLGQPAPPSEDWTSHHNPASTLRPTYV